MSERSDLEAVVSYAKPPILEAVIAIHFDPILKVKSMQSFARKVKARFPVEENLMNIQFQISGDQNHPAQNSASQQQIGIRISNTNKDKLIVMDSSHFTLTALAPYAGWDTLVSDLQSSWDALLRVTGYMAVTRVSTRFINRFDIPLKNSANFDLSRYFNIGPHVPMPKSPISVEGFGMNVTMRQPAEMIEHLVQFAPIASPLIGYSSMILDIDSYTISEMMTNPDLIWHNFAKLRKSKDEIFESCITDATRDLIQ